MHENLNVNNAPLIRGNEIHQTLSTSRDSYLTQIQISMNFRYKQKKYMPAYETVLLIAYARMPLINPNADVPSKAGGLKFCLSPHKHPYFVNVSSNGPGETAHMHRLA